MNDSFCLWSMHPEKEKNANEEELDQLLALINQAQTHPNKIQNLVIL